jgi:release factor glutamine methyltransferase
MRPSDTLRLGSEYLERHGVESPRQTAEVLMAHVLRTDRVGLYARGDGLTVAEARMFGRAICQRSAGTPLQHLTGEQKFRRIALEVRPGVFVPRPETEVLVEVALQTLGAAEGPLVVDVGTGTGAIALAIKDERPDAKVYATDLSPEAVELARANAARLGLELAIAEGRFLDPIPEDLRGWVDLLVSNPPYVTREEYEDLPEEVRADPELALVGGVELHRQLAEEGARWLRDGGVLALEIGAAQGEEVAAVLTDLLYMDVRVERDLAGRDRVVVGRRP